MLVANVSILFTERPFLERFAAARRAGFGAVEFWWPTDDPAAVAGAVRDAGVEVALINFDGGDVAAGDRGLANDPAREARFHANVPVALELARAVGCRQLNALVGIALPELPRDEQLARAAANVRLAARAAAPLTVLIEAINTLDNGPYLVPTTAEAAAFVRAVGEPNVRLQYDVFHMTRMGEDVEAALREHIDAIAHVQIADHPGRGEPGSGQIDFAALFAHLGRGLVETEREHARALELLVLGGRTASRRRPSPPPSRRSARACLQVRPPAPRPAQAVPPDACQLPQTAGPRVGEFRLHDRSSHDNAPDFLLLSRVSPPRRSRAALPPHRCADPADLVTALPPRLPA